MNRILILFVLIILSANAFGQCVILYSYDNIGNRIKRVYDCSFFNQGGDGGNPGPGQGSRITSNNSQQSIDSTNILNTCSLYPNPSTGFFKALLKYPVSNADVYVMDVKGSVVQKAKIDGGTEADFDITRFPPGTYTLHLVSPNYQFSVKIIKE